MSLVARRMSEEIKKQPLESKVDRLLRVLPYDEAGALKQLLHDPAVSPNTLERVLKEEGQSADRPPHVHEDYYTIGETTIRRWRRLNKNSEIRGL